MHFSHSSCFHPKQSHLYQVLHCNLECSERDRTENQGVINCVSPHARISWYPKLQKCTCFLSEYQTKGVARLCNNGLFLTSLIMVMNTAEIAFVNKAIGFCLEISLFCKHDLSLPAFPQHTAPTALPETTAHALLLPYYHWKIVCLCSEGHCFS